MEEKLKEKKSAMTNKDTSTTAKRKPLSQRLMSKDYNKSRVGKGL